MPGNVAQMRRFWTISRNQLRFKTQQVWYFEATSRIHYLINFTWLTDLSLFVCVACSKRGIDLAWSRCRTVWTFEPVSAADALPKIRGHTESNEVYFRWAKCDKRPKMKPRHLLTRVKSSTTKENSPKNRARYDSGIQVWPRSMRPSSALHHTFKSTHLDNTFKLKLGVK